MLNAEFDDNFSFYDLNCELFFELLYWFYTTPTYY